jgi:hypothetical protein
MIVYIDNSVGSLISSYNYKDRKLWNSKSIYKNQLHFYILVTILEIETENTTIYNSMKMCEIFRDKSNKRCVKFVHQRLHSIGERD